MDGTQHPASVSDVQAVRELLEQQINAVDLSSDNRYRQVEMAVAAMAAVHDRDIDRLRAELINEVKQLGVLRELKTGNVRDEMVALVSSHISSHKDQHADMRLVQEKFERIIDEKFSTFNRFREQLNAERETFVRRDVIDEKLAAQDARFQAYIEQIDKRIRPIENIRNSLMLLGTVMVILITLLDFLIRVAVQ